LDVYEKKILTVKCPHCKEAELVIVGADEPWHNEHYQCPECDSTYPIFQEFEVTYEWIVKDSGGNVLAYKLPEENPVFIDAEGAVLQMIETIKVMQTASKNTSNLLADLSRML
jgi:hypothetical protein